MGLAASWQRIVDWKWAQRKLKKLPAVDVPPRSSTPKRAFEARTPLVSDAQFGPFLSTLFAPSDCINKELCVGAVRVGNQRAGRGTKRSFHNRCIVERFETVLPLSVASARSARSLSRSPRDYSPHLTSPHLTSPHLTSPHLTLTLTGVTAPRSSPWALSGPPSRTGWLPRPGTTERGCWRPARCVKAGGELEDDGFGFGQKQRQLKKNVSSLLLLLLFLLSPLVFLSLLKPSTQNQLLLFSFNQVNGCNGRVATPNNERVGLCDVHARGGCIFLQRFPEARGSFAEPGWYPVGYCTHRGHTRWLGAYKVDPMTGKLQST